MTGELPGEAVRALSRARSLVALTGAGVSEESGIPTFRGGDGFWKGVRPEDLASPEGFARDPAMVWAWYASRVSAIRAARPNPAHDTLARLERRMRVTVVTQNVDGLHRDAGSATVLELHGSIRRVRCHRQGCRDGDGRFPDLPDGDDPPRCRCGERLRPDVVWFGEMLPEGILDAAGEALRGADIVLVAGTSSVVYPAAALPLAALEAGIPVLEVNPEETPLTPLATWSVRGLAGRVLPALREAADAEPGAS